MALVKFIAKLITAPTRSALPSINKCSLDIPVRSSICKRSYACSSHADYIRGLWTRMQKQPACKESKAVYVRFRSRKSSTNTTFFHSPIGFVAGQQMSSDIEVFLLKKWSSAHLARSMIISRLSTLAFHSWKACWGKIPNFIKWKKFERSCMNWIIW